MSRGFLRVVALSAVLKVVLALVFADIPPHYDETEFLEFGRAILEERMPPSLWRAPGYQWFVAGGLALGGGRAVGVRLLQVALSVMASVLAYRIARRRWNERTALAAGGFLAFYPSHVAFSHLLWSETLYGFLVLAAAERLLAAEEGGGIGGVVAAGFFLGAAALTRSLGLALLAASAIWLLLGAGGARRFASAGALLVAALLVVAPWSLRATKRAGRFVAVDVNGGFNLWSGNNRYIPSDAQGIWCVGLPLETEMGSRVHDVLPDSAWRGEVRARMLRAGVSDPLGARAEEWYRGEALREIRRNPAAALRRIPKKLAALWAPDFFLPRHLVRDWYGPVAPGAAAVLLLLTWAAAALPLLGGPAALAAMGADRLRTLTILWVLAYLAAHSLAYGHSRMHQPLVALLALAVFACLFDERLRPSRGRLLRRGAPWAALALGLWVLAYPLVVGLYLMPNARHAQLARALTCVRNVLPAAGRERLVWLRAGAALASGGDAMEAERVLSEGPGAQHPWTLFLRGWIDPDPARAERFFRQAVARDPKHYPALEWLAWLRVRAGDPQEAEHFAARARAARPWAEGLALPGRPLPTWTRQGGGL